MRLTKNTGWAFVLIILGICILLNAFGLGIGILTGVLIPLSLLLFGYIGIKNGKSFIGWSLFIIGLIILISKFTGLLGMLLAISFIIIGISMLRNRSKAYE